MSWLAQAMGGGDASGVPAWISDDGTLALTNGQGHAVCATGRHRVALEGIAWRTGDSQVLTAQEVASWIAGEGLLAALRGMDGAFVLVHWDAVRRELSCARDPSGQRMLFYGWMGGKFAFASSLHGLRQDPDFDGRIDYGVLALFLRHGYVPAPHCIHAGFFKLSAGRCLTLHERDVRRGWECHLPGVDQRVYWDAAGAYEAALQMRQPLAADSALDQLDARLHDVVAASRRAGTTGAFLSGGTDSSLVAAILQAQSSVPVPTIGIGFEAAGHDERKWMEAVARHLGVRHETCVLEAGSALERVQQAARAWSEPFADASQLPTLLASERLARRCEIGLTGDGGDELFFGHGAYLRARRNARLGALLPQVMRTWANRLHRRDPERSRLGGMAALYAEAAGSGVAHHYLMRVEKWREPGALLPGAAEPRTPYRDGPVHLQRGDPVDVIQYLDFAMELGNGILAKVDAAAAEYGLKTLSPLLDREVAGLAWQMPIAMKFQAGEQKWILKKLLCRYLPASLVYRPKRGFGPPIAAWLRGPLRGWASALLAPATLEHAGIRDDGRVAKMWSQFQRGERRWHPPLWTLLMYLAWFEQSCKKGDGGD
ncbi:asparagine synthetase B family protein [Stenotrophomonas tumulicola]|uniref:asparagine synthase (glutamine-hydrolyzing) n=1 Tax=Stenotrophomonas tumulicola TaxID=1685415 RepID=A0A7W3FP65_9GAMM|nr:asparagine synthase-related protein [Stenotrophomonas tumulicola]MBA8683188.1 asparagine synthetase B [Stenotrophomonas tumulicola]